MNRSDDVQQLSMRTHVIVILLFCVATVLFTWPLAINLNTSPGGDAFLFIHSFWWFKKALITLSNPFYTNYIFYPEGVNLAFQSSTFGNFLLTLPVTFAAGPVAGVNVAYMLTYVLAAYFTYLLAHKLTGDHFAACAAAIVYGFSPMHYTQNVGHLHISSIHCLPAVLYALHRAMSERSDSWTVISGIFLGMTLLTDQFQSILVSLALSFALIWCFRNSSVLNMSYRAIVRQFLIAVFVSVVVSLPYLVAVLRFTRKNSSAFELGIFDRGGANFYSADLLSFILPPAITPVIGKLAQYWSFPVRDTLPYVGWTVLLLLLVSSFMIKTVRTQRILWLSAASTFILSLGTTLHIGGRWQWADGLSLKLPFYLLAHLPVFSQIRTPNRFHIATSLALGLLVAFAIKGIRKRFAEHTSPLNMTAASILVLTSVIIEYLPPPHQVPELPDSPLIRTIGKKPHETPLLWLPLSRLSAIARNGAESPDLSMYYQTVHNKPMFNGMVSRINHENLEFDDVLLRRINFYSKRDLVTFDGTTYVNSPVELELICQEAIMLRPAWNKFREKYQMNEVIVQKPYNQSGTGTKKFIECLTGMNLKDEAESGLSFLLM